MIDKGARAPLRLSAIITVGALAALLAAAVAPALAAAPAALPAAAATPPQVLAQRMLAAFRNANAYWAREFTVLGGNYPAPALSVFRGSMANACGLPQVSGPFYCPASQTVYLDQAFVSDALARTSENDDAALELIVGHEVAHHVQNVLGTTAAVEQARSRSTPALSTRTWTAEELQADCYAALSMAGEVASGRLKIADAGALLAGISEVSRERESHLGAHTSMPDPLLTYGTPEQRLRWFNSGLHGKGLADCDTFAADAAGKL